MPSLILNVRNDVSSGEAITDMFENANMITSSKEISRLIPFTLNHLRLLNQRGSFSAPLVSFLFEYYNIRCSIPTLDKNLDLLGCRRNVQRASENTSSCFRKPGAIYKHIISIAGSY